MCLNAFFPTNVKTKQKNSDRTQKHQNPQKNRHENCALQVLSENTLHHQHIGCVVVSETLPNKHNLSVFSQTVLISPADEVPIHYYLHFCRSSYFVSQLGETTCSLSFNPSCTNHNIICLPNGRRVAWKWRSAGQDYWVRICLFKYNKKVCQYASHGLHFVIMSKTIKYLVY